MIDYARAKKNGPKLKGALTRAVNSGDSEKIRTACLKAVREWDEWGAWPDDWARWQCALNDSMAWNQSIDLRDLR